MAGSLKVFLTGGAGYVGSVLVRRLFEEGYGVTVLDALLFGNDGVEDLFGERGFKVVSEDVRVYNPEHIRGHDVVVDLAAISQPDPAGRIDQKLFYEVNFVAAVRTARLASANGVERLVFTSTCSVYGFRDEPVDEGSPTNPLEVYARSKSMAEQHILGVKGLTKTVLRLATVYGYSPKMRFDLVANAMTLALYKYGKIFVGRPGTQRRPVVHVGDVAEAILKVLEAPKDVVDGEVFNVGSNEQNYTVLDLAREVGSSIVKPYTIEMYGDPDARSYVVKFNKIEDVLKFKCRHTVADGAREVYNALERGLVVDKPSTKVIDWWHKLQSEGVVKPLGVSI